MTKELLYKIEIPLYVRSYIRSNSMRGKFYEKGGKKEIPIFACDKEIFEKEGKRVPDRIRYNWKKFIVLSKGKKIEKSYLVNREGLRAYANPNHVGKQNTQTINGQDIYNGNSSRHDRNKMMGVIKDMYKVAIKDLPKITRFPLRIDVYLFDTIIDDVFSSRQDWDIDNRFFPYGKAFADILKKEGKIPDDNRYFITEPPHAVFVPVEEDTERKFFIEIYKDNRPVIINNYLYKMKHGNALI